MLAFPGVAFAATYTTIADGNWNSAGTWSGGSTPPSNGEIGSGDIVNIHHTVNYNTGNNIKNEGLINITPLVGTSAELIVPTGINMENFGEWRVVNAALTQYRFVGGGDSGLAQSGTFKNIGGVVYVEGSYVEVAQDWTNESSATRTFINSCLLTGQNFSNSDSIDILRDANVSIGWHGSGSFQYSLSDFEFRRTQIQLAGTSGNFELNKGVAFGDIDYITLKNHVTNSIGSGKVFASSDLDTSTPLVLDAYCANTYEPNGEFSGSQTADTPNCPLTNTYFPCVVSSPNYSLTVAKDATDVEGDGTGNGPAAVGDTITYDIVVTNDGDTALTNVTVDDDLTGTTDALCAASLDPSDSCTVQVQYVVTQADLDGNGGGDGDIDNTATADSDQTDPETDDESVPLVSPNPEITIVKTPSPTSFSATGVSITYTFDVQNTGNLTLTGVGVTDPLEGLGSITCNWAGSSDGATPAGTLSPDETVACSASLSTTQAHLNAGSINNTATATGSSPGNSNDVTDTDDATVTAMQLPSLSLTKTGVSGENPPKNDYNTAGDTLSYSFLVTNDGNVSLAGPVTVDDDKASDESCPALPAEDGFPSGKLDPGESTTCTASYAVSGADVTAGSVTNTATASADGVDSNEDTATLFAESNPTPEIKITKSASPITFDATGVTITYTFDVQNTGNVALTGVEVSDSLTGSGLSAISCDGGSFDGTLEPDETVQCTATLDTDQADLDAGKIDNTVTAVGLPPECDAGDNGPPECAVTDTDDESVTAQQNPAITIDKSASPGSYSAASQVITYTFVLENTGNVTLEGVQVTDTLSGAGLSAISCEGGGFDGILSPDETVECTATLTTDADDVTAGRIDNTATGSGLPPDCEPGDNGLPDCAVTDTDDETVYLEGINLSKSAAPAVDNGDGTFDVTYTITADNQGEIDSTYNLADMLFQGEALTPDLLVTTLTYVPGSETTQDGDIKNPIVLQDFIDGNTLVTDEPLAKGLNESWTFTIRFTFDAEKITQDNADCTDQEEENYTGFNNRVSGSDTDPNGDDNWACVPLEVILLEADPFCDNDVPWMHYKVEVFGIPGVQPGDVSYTWINIEDDPPNEIIVEGPTAMSAYEEDLLWPGATADGPDPGANGLTWPGWVESPPGVWQEVETAATPNLEFVVSVNPEASASLVYPSVTKECNPAPPPVMTVVKSVEDQTNNPDGSVDITYRLTVDNTGGQQGTYTLEDTLDVGPAISPVDSNAAVPINYDGGTEDDPSGVPGTPLAGDFLTGATIVEDENLAAGKNESFLFSLSLAIDYGQLSPEDNICSSDGGNEDGGIGNDVDLLENEQVIDEDSICTSVSGPLTVFFVTKDFTDDNPAEVTVRLQCDAGTYTIDQANITDPDTDGTFPLVGFVVFNIPSIGTNCRVWEEPVPGGYTDSYLASAEAGALYGDLGEDEAGCYYEEVASGYYNCEITDTLDEGPVIVIKEWDVTAIESEIPLKAKVHWQCFNVRLSPDGDLENHSGKHIFKGEEPPELEIKGIYPDYDGESYCEVTETVSDSAVEIDDSDCDKVEVPLGADPPPSCTIYNTVFFEGIPTLSQYGLVMLVLLMLSVGLAGVRRLA